MENGVEEIKEKILNKINLELNTISNISTTKCDKNLSEAIKNLSEAYINLC